MAPRQYRVRNWSKFQHYKNRNPPWIKLHVELLSSEDWVSLDDASKLLAIVCMVIASKNDGHVPDNPEYIQRVAYLCRKPNIKPLIECGFLENLQAGASESKQKITTACPEKEGETEKEHKVSRATRFDEFWLVCPRKIGKGAAEKSWNKIIKIEQQDTLITAMRCFAGQCKDSEPKFIPHPATWLNQKRWMDEGLMPLEPIDQVEIDAAKDKADRYFKRGVYAEKYQ